MPETVQPIPPRVVDAAVLAALEEDGAYDDVTTRALVDPARWGSGTFTAKETGVIAGLPVSAAAMTALDSTVSFDALVQEGAIARPGDQLAEVEGPLSVILAAERVALNFLQRLSGIASLTRDYVDAVAHTRARILDTRKTTPGLRQLERYAVRVGGGRNHRFNLADGVLIKDNHITAARQAGAVHLGQIVSQARAAAPHAMRIEIEVTTVEEAEEAADGGADVILLDNMPPEEIRSAVEVIAGRALVEASGGVTLETVRAVAEAGVDFISVGRLTHSAPALDISLEVSGL
ncbi:MAG: carboxylating nicotinate-nucleotide diphosphorylase [Dehalococcoidia bacterium]